MRPELHARVALPRVVHAGEGGADRLARREPGVGVDERRVAQLERLDAVFGGGEGDRLRHLRDVLVELRHPQRVVHLVEVGEKRPLLALLDLEVAPHGLERVRGGEAVVLHQLPRHLGGDRAVDVLVELDLPDAAQPLLDLTGRRRARRRRGRGLLGHRRTLARDAEAAGDFPREAENGSIGGLPSVSLTESLHPSFEPWFREQLPDVPFDGARAALALFSQGATVPFVARYRKEAHREPRRGRPAAYGSRRGTASTASSRARRSSSSRSSVTPASPTSCAPASSRRSTPTRSRTSTTPTGSRRRTARSPRARPASSRSPTGSGTPATAPRPRRRARRSSCGRSRSAARRRGSPTPRRRSRARATSSSSGSPATPSCARSCGGPTSRHGVVRATKTDKAKPGSKFEGYFAFEEKVASLREPAASPRYLAVRRGQSEGELQVVVAGKADDAEFEPRLVAAFEARGLHRARRARRRGAAPRRPDRVQERRPHVGRERGPPHAEGRRRRGGGARSSPRTCASCCSSRRSDRSRSSASTPARGTVAGRRAGGHGRLAGTEVVHLQTDEQKTAAAEALVRLAREQGHPRGGDRQRRRRPRGRGLHAQGAPRRRDRRAGRAGERGGVERLRARARRRAAEFPELEPTRARGGLDRAGGSRTRSPSSSSSSRALSASASTSTTSPTPLLQKALDAVVESCVNARRRRPQHRAARRSSPASPASARRSPRRSSSTATKQRAVPLAPAAARGAADLGPKAFEQAAGFLRVRGGEHPLDATGVHPERYAALEALAAATRRGPGGAARAGSGARARSRGARSDGARARSPARTSSPSSRSRGRDPRGPFAPFSFRDDVQRLEDVKPGMACPGIVTNVTAFGAFVDIGVHHDGLVHVSQLGRHVREGAARGRPPRRAGRGPGAEGRPREEADLPDDAQATGAPAGPRSRCGGRRSARTRNGPHPHPRRPRRRRGEADRGPGTPAPARPAASAPSAAARRASARWRAPGGVAVRAARPGPAGRPGPAAADRPARPERRPSGPPLDKRPDTRRPAFNNPFAVLAGLKVPPKK